MNNLDTKFMIIEIRIFFVNLNTRCYLIKKANRIKG